MVEAAGADLVDLNFGCPVKKVTKTGAGATLLDDPDRAAAIVEAIADGGRDPGERQAAPRAARRRRATASSSARGSSRRAPRR